MPACPTPRDRQGAVLLSSPFHSVPLSRRNVAHRRRWGGVSALLIKHQISLIQGNLGVDPATHTRQSTHVRGHAPQAEVDRGEPTEYLCDANAMRLVMRTARIIGLQLCDRPPATRVRHRRHAPIIAGCDTESA